MLAAAPATNTRQSPANAAKQPAPPAQLDSAAKKKSEQAEKRRRDAFEAELEQLKRLTKEETHVRAFSTRG